eukprot:symbB.v1.2.036146.t1/scaffold5035.1/size31620/1
MNGCGSKSLQNCYLQGRRQHQHDDRGAIVPAVELPKHRLGLCRASTTCGLRKVLMSARPCVLAPALSSEKYCEVKNPVYYVPSADGKEVPFVAGTIHELKGMDAVVNVGEEQHRFPISELRRRFMRDDGATCSSRGG